MNSREFAIDVVRRLTDAGYTAYWAGGCVRDLLLGKAPNDFDVATTATPEQVRELFGMRRTLAVGASFGVIIVLGPKTAEQVEVATFRSEGEYIDGRRPETVAFSTPEKDAQRRDFTINGMFYDPLADAVHDFVGGEEDLKRRIVRAIGDPHARMTEDKLRLLRAVRFTAAMAFELDEQTADAVRAMASQIVVVSAERISQELKKMLSHPHRARAMELCERLGLLKVILPEVYDLTVRESDEGWNQRLRTLQQLGEVSFDVAMATLLRDVPSPAVHRKQEQPGTVMGICRRLKLSNQEAEAISWLVACRDIIERFTDFDLAEKKRLLIEPHFAELFHIEQTVATIEQRNMQPYGDVEQFLVQTPQEELNPPEILNGQQLIAAGYKPGRQFHVWLRAVRDAQLRNEVATTEEALSLVGELSRAV